MHWGSLHNDNQHDNYFQKGTQSMTDTTVENGTWTSEKEVWLEENVFNELASPHLHQD